MAYALGAGAYYFYSFGQDLREAHQGYTMALSQYVDNMDRLLEDLRPFGSRYARAAWEDTFVGDKIVRMQQDLLAQAQRLHDTIATVSFPEAHHARDHRSAVEEIQNIIRELDYYVRFLLRLGIQA